VHCGIQNGLQSCYIKCYLTVIQSKIVTCEAGTVFYLLFLIYLLVLGCVVDNCIIYYIFRLTQLALSVIRQVV
jgi:hypothetical protein